MVTGLHSQLDVEVEPCRTRMVMNASWNVFDISPEEMSK